VGERPEAADQKRVEERVQPQPYGHKHHGGNGIAYAPENEIREKAEIKEDHSRKVYFKVGRRHGEIFRRRRHKPQKGVTRKHARHRHHGA
jgi:hypothetical protein